MRTSLQRTSSKSVRVLVVDDNDSWHGFVSRTLRKEQELQIIGNVSDGLEAVQHAERLQPELILMDIGLPTLNGIEAARRIRDVSPTSKILFLSENRSLGVAQEALSNGCGYVVKSDAGSELLPAIKAVLGGKRFISASLGGQGLNEPPDPQPGIRFQRDSIATFTSPQKVGITRHHKVGFYSDDRHFLDDATRFVEGALKDGNVVIVVATEPHRESLLSELQACGLDMRAAMEQGRYIQLYEGDMLSMFMVNGMPDPVRFGAFSSDLIATAREAVRGTNHRVSVLGECASLLWAQGNADAAIQLEKLCNELTKIDDVDILCGYSLSNVKGGMDSSIFEQICAEHTAVYSR